MIAIMYATLIEGLRNLVPRDSPGARRFAAGTCLFRQGDPVRLLHVIVRGEAHLLRHQPGGTTLTLQRAGPGSILAEASLYSDRYHCDAVAVRPTEALALPAAAIRTGLAAEPELAAVWAAFLAREVQSARLRAEILSLRTVAERLDAWFSANDGARPATGTWTGGAKTGGAWARGEGKRAATEMGVSPEALYRELARRRRASTP